MEECKNCQSLSSRLKEAEHQLSLHKDVLKNECENEDELRKIAKKVLTEHEVEGDSYGVPMIQDIAELLVGKIQSLEQRLSQAEEHIKDISGIKARACEARNDALGELEEVKNRLSQAEAINTENGCEMIDLNKRLSHLMDVAGKLEKALSQVVWNLDGDIDEDSLHGRTVKIAKLALAEWDGIKNQ